MTGLLPGMEATMSEAAFMAKVREIAELYRWECYHTHRSDRSDAGWPDLVLAKAPRIMFVELKSEKGKVTKAQAEWLARLKACGQEVAVWRPSDLERIARVLGPRAEPATRRPEGLDSGARHDVASPHHVKGQYS